MWWGAQRQLPRCRKCYIIPIRTSERGSQREGGTQDFNIKTGAAFFAQTLSDNGGSLLKTFGNYNGWQPGLTVVSTQPASVYCFRSLNVQASATAARWSSCCRCQNNLD